MNALSKRRIVRTCLAVMLFFSTAMASLSALAADIDIGKSNEMEMRHEMKPQMCHMMQEGRGGKGHHHDRMMQALKKLDITETQEKSIHQIRVSTKKDMIQKWANLKIAKLELQEQLHGDSIEMTAVETQANKIQGLKAGLMLKRIKAHQDIKSLLTPEQKKKLTEIMQSSRENYHDSHPRG